MKKFNYEDLQPHVEMLIDALENNTVSSQLRGLRLKHLIVDEAQDMPL